MANDLLFFLSLLFAGFTVLSVVETVLATSWHRMLWFPMSVARSCFRRLATAPAGLPLLRPGKGQGCRQVTDL
jgi:hypothetical protein